MLVEDDFVGAKILTNFIEVIVTLRTVFYPFSVLLANPQ